MLSNIFTQYSLIKVQCNCHQEQVNAAWRLKSDRPPRPLARVVPCVPSFANPHAFDHQRNPRTDAVCQPWTRIAQIRLHVESCGADQVDLEERPPSASAHPPCRHQNCPEGCTHQQRFLPDRWTKYQRNAKHSTTKLESTC